MGASQDAPRGGWHTPVLYQEVLSALDPRAEGRYIDGTIGAGGHAHGILERSSPDGQLLGLDRDPQALAAARERLAVFGGRAALRHASFAEMARFAAELGWSSVDGILLDLGLSSMQLADPQRGFSFRAAGPLDMRFDPTAGPTADELVNSLPEAELADLIFRYGEERHARRIARALVAARPIGDTQRLADLVARAVGGGRGRLHPATRTFQALRIAVNDELQTLEVGLEGAVEILAPGGRLAVITFHSLEDRIVKRRFRGDVRLRALNRKPIRPAESELRANPRARSAKMRVTERRGNS